MDEEGNLALELAISILALCMGAFLSFFTAGVALFADSGSVWETWSIVPVGAGIILVVALVCGASAPRIWRVVAICTAVPVLFVLAFFGWGFLRGGVELYLWLLVPAFAVAYFAAAFLGAWLGMKVRSKLRARREPTDAGTPELQGQDASGTA